MGFAYGLDRARVKGGACSSFFHLSPPGSGDKIIPFSRRIFLHPSQADRKTKHLAACPIFVRCHPAVEGRTHHDRQRHHAKTKKQTGSGTPIDAVP